MLYFAGEKGNMAVQQTPQDLIWTYGNSPEITCYHNIQNYDRLLWYKQSQHKALTFMGNLIGEMGNPEQTFQNKIKIHGNANKYRGYLTLLNISSEHSAVYFCAAYYTVTPIFYSPIQKRILVTVGTPVINHCYCRYCISHFYNQVS